MFERRDIHLGDRRVLLLGTNVIGPDTLQAIEDEIISAEPDAVIVDYDETRWSWLAEPELRENLDLVQVIKNGDLAVLNSRLAFSVLQKQLAPRHEVAPDADILAAARAAEKVGANLVFGRRPVEIEGVRSWRAGNLWRRLQLGLSLVIGSLKPSTVEAEEVNKLRREYTPGEVRAEARMRARTAGPVVFDEADHWLARTIHETQGDVVVVANATAIESVSQLTQSSSPPVTDGFDLIPQPSAFARALPWLFSAAIVAAFVLGFIFADFDKMMSALLAWCVSNATMAALGATLAAAHPWTILATALTAPFVSLNPAVGAGMVGAFVQALVAPPSVRDMESVGDDVSELKGWWRNRLSRILLIFVFANVSSSFGSVIAFAWFPT